MADVKNHLIGGLIALLLLTSITTLMFTLNSGTGDQSDAVGGVIDTNSVKGFNSTIYNNNNITNTVTELKQDISNLQPKLDLTSVISLPVAFIQTGWDLVKLAIQSFDSMNGMFTTLSAYLGIPEWAVGFLTLIISTGLVFAILYLIFGKDF